MRLGDNNPPADDDIPLSRFELPEFLVRPAVTACRLFNTVADGMFYDVPGLRRALYEGDRAVAESGEKAPSRIVDFDALADPEGSLLLIDAQTSPFVHRYKDVQAYLSSPYPETREVMVASITGVGSSALGSAALAWDLSAALKQPVLAIVPGYGMADMMLQGLGGWFGFGMSDWLDSKTAIQTMLAAMAPRAAAIGRHLPETTGETREVNGAPVFRHGSGSSDVLHTLMKDRAAPFRLLVGHSKGALQIGNAIRSLPPERTDGLQVVTLGCPIAREVQGVTYHQYLGLFDALGQMNMWGNWPDVWTWTRHSTNPWLPPAMDAGALAVEAAPAD